MKSLKDKGESLKKHINRNIPFVILCGFIFVILITILFSIIKSDEVKKMPAVVKDSTNEGESKDWDTTSLGVIKEIDIKNSKITFLEIESGQDIILTFSGGSDIRDKYNQIIAMSQVTVGEMMDIYYYKNSAKLKKAVISANAWEYKGVSNWSLDKNSFDIVDSKYQYSNDLVISRDGKLLTINDLDDKDELTVKGWDREVWSIIVTKGHGTLRFTDYEDFVGGIAYIGKREIIPITTDLVITAREGIFDITFENKGLVGVKNVTLNPGDDIVVSMEEFKRPPVETGLVRFNIEPVGAELYINKILYSYEDMVELEYGEYNISVSLGGYNTYQGKLVVDDAVKTVSISLVESSTDTGETDEGEAGGMEEGETGESEEEEPDTTLGGSDKPDEDSSNTTSKYIYIQSPSGASAYLDGEFKGTVPVSFPKVTGTHYITFIKSGNETKTYTVEILDDGENVKLEFPELTDVE